MARSKKRKRHTCKNHRTRVARGRCSKCRAWICTECAVLDKGLFYCRDTCSQQPADDTRNAATAPAAAAARRSPAPAAGKPARLRHKIVPMAAVTFGLCGVAFGLWSLRNASIVNTENRRLLSQRTTLIKNLEKVMQREKQLETRLALLSDSLASAHTAGTRPRKQNPSIQQYAVLDYQGRLPLSFDNGSTSEKFVSITFDGDGLSNAATDILDTLASRGVTTTMFLTGTFMKRNPELLRRIVDDGHEVANHTCRHPRLTSWAETRTHTTLPGVTEEFIRNELVCADKVFIKMTGNHLSPLWRAPYGEKNNEICRWAQRAGYLHVGWKQGRTWFQNLDSNDWVPDEETPGYHSPEAVREKMLAHARSRPYGINGGIVLMHLGSVRKDRSTQVHRILGLIIDDLERLGYRLTTISEMAHKSGIDLGLLRGNASARSTDFIAESCEIVFKKRTRAETRRRGEKYADYDQLECKSVSGGG